MFLVFLKIASLLAPLGPLLRGAFTQGSAVIVAAISAVPPTIEAVGKLLDYVSTRPLAAFLLGCCLAAPGGIYYGLSWDAPLRQSAKQAAITQANRMATLAIEREREKAAQLVRVAMQERDAALAKLKTVSKKR